jgi:hypothetical protein
MRGGRRGKFGALRAPEIPKTVDESRNAVAHVCNVEVQQKAGPEPTETEIAQDLSSMNGQDCLDGLQFHYQQAAYEHVNPIAVFNDQLIVSNRN